MNNLQGKNKGFTLVEMMLVLVIISAIMVTLIGYGTQKTAQLRRDKTASQMQQVLNAAMAYYVSNGYWPHNTAHTNYFVSSSDLVSKGYLPATFAADPYVGAVSVLGDNQYYINDNTAPSGTFTGTFTVFAPMPSQTEATLVSGMVPGGYVAASGASYAAAAMINVPGQNLNNARSINYAGVYSSGACVPAPVCPGTMLPQILVAPASVSGVYDPPGTPITNADYTGGTPSCTADSNPSSCTNVVVTPVTSFTAFAQGNGSDPIPVNCDGSAGTACNAAASDPTGTNYWRACLSVVTSKGAVVPSSSESYPNNHGLLSGNIIAFTRCVPATKVGGVPTITESPVGTPIGVWSK